jgi:hypothetical protein
LAGAGHTTLQSSQTPHTGNVKPGRLFDPFSRGSDGCQVCCGEDPVKRTSSRLQPVCQIRLVGQGASSRHQRFGGLWGKVESSGCPFLEGTASIRQRCLTLVCFPQQCELAGTSLGNYRFQSDELLF